MFEPNLICTWGHKSYSPNPEHWVTTNDNQRFCAECSRIGRFSPVRLIGSYYRYQNPLMIDVPAAIRDT